MKTKQPKIKISESDYHLLCELVRDRKREAGESAEKLGAELKRASVVSDTKLERDFVKMNSTVVIDEPGGNGLFEITIVHPDESDISRRRISVFAPLATALIGFRQGDAIEWEVPAGRKTFVIRRVINEND